MRDLDKRQILTGDFIVVYGDIVSNFPMDAALAAHRARRAKDKNAIMTMVLRAAGTSHRTKAQGNSPVFVVDPTKERCIHYEQMNPLQAHHHIEIDPELLVAHQEIDIRHDLIDCGIDICTPDVLALWSDNFDYEVPRRGFLHSVLKDYELNGKTIHTHILEEAHYAARVRNLHAYDSVSKDMLARWTYPIVPDSNIAGDSRYSFEKGNVYLEDGVDLARSCRLGRGTQVGSGTKIGEKSEIRASIIGRDCRIGRDCVIEDSYIWHGASIGNGCVIKKAIVANEAVVGSKCTIEEGALLSYGVKVADGKTISQRQRLMRSGNGDQPKEYKPEDEEDSDTVAGLSGPRKLILTSLVPCLLTLISTVYNLPNLSDNSISTIHSDLEDDELSDAELPAKHIGTRSDRASSFISIGSVDSDSTSKPTASESAFHHDAASSIHDALKEGTEVSTIQLELQALRMSANASEHQVRRAIVTALIRWCVESKRKSTASVQQVVKPILAANKMLVQRCVFDKGDTVDGKKPDQVDLLLLMQRDLASRVEKGGEVALGTDNMLTAVCLELYEDVLEQEGLEQWWEDERSQAGEGMKSVRGQMTKFLETITAETDSEEESSEEEDDDEDESEDD